jgi:hypothetical protein
VGLTGLKQFNFHFYLIVGLSSSFIYRGKQIWDYDLDLKKLLTVERKTVCEEKAAEMTKKKSRKNKLIFTSKT